MVTSNKTIQPDKILAGITVLASVLVAVSFVLLYGFKEPVVSTRFLYSLQVALFAYFIGEKVYRVVNSDWDRAFWRQNRVEVTVLVLLIGFMLVQLVVSSPHNRGMVWHTVGVCLIVQVLIKLCRNTVHLASLGKNPTLMLIVSFLVLITVGSGVLCLPNASTGARLGVVDALFTATSATCVTGLVVKDTGQDFSVMGQSVILVLMQLGGLGIVVFGAVLSLLLGQAFTLRESAAMQDLLSSQTLNRIGQMIGFIFMATLVIEVLGTLGLYCMWDNAPDWTGAARHKWFYSLFHSVSAFCNAGFGLCSDSLVSYRGSWGVYGIICPLIVLGGLGFGVLYNLCNVLVDWIRCLGRTHGQTGTPMPVRKRISLQAKIVVSVSALLVVMGAVVIVFFESRHNVDFGTSDAFFQSITARTAGFNTVDIRSLAPPSRLAMILLMIIGGSPGSTAGGIKTVTFAVVIMTVVISLRKRSEVDMFKRTIHAVVVRRALTVMSLYVLILFTLIFMLSATEGANPYISLADIEFEAASALGTVGLTTGITPFLTVPGKWIIIAAMLIGRLGPLTLLAAVTFDLKPARYSYAHEAIIVG
jgi:trk system potassium uptake protein